MKKESGIDKNKSEDKDKGNKVQEPTLPKCKSEHVQRYYVMNYQDYIKFIKRVKKDLKIPQV